MTGRIQINAERCKGCGLCVKVCPSGGITISKKSNKNGFFPAEAANSDCTGCAVCAIICPDAVITVYREARIVAIEKKAKAKATFVRDKTQ